MLINGKLNSSNFQFEEKQKVKVTDFFNDDFKVIKKVTPKKGTGLFFNSNIWHSASNPIQASERIIINYIFSIKQDN